MPQNTHATITTERLDLLTMADQVDLNGLGQRRTASRFVRRRRAVARGGPVPGGRVRRRAVRPVGRINQLRGCRGGWLRLVGRGPPVLDALEQAALPEVLLVFGPRKGRLMGSADHPPTTALINCHASGSPLPPIRGCSAPRDGGIGPRQLAPRVGRARVRPVIDNPAEFHRARMLRRRLDELNIPVQAWRGGEAPREDARIHTSAPPQARSRIRWSTRFASTRPRTPSRCCANGLLWWRVDELGIRAGGRPCTP